MGLSQLHTQIRKSLTKLALDYYEFMYNKPAAGKKTLAKFIESALSIFVDYPAKNSIAIDYESFEAALKKVFADYYAKTGEILFNPAKVRKKLYLLSTKLLDFPSAEVQFIFSLVFTNGLKQIAGKDFALKVFNTMHPLPLSRTWLGIISLWLINFYNVQRFLSDINNDNWDENKVYAFLVIAYLTILRQTYLALEKFKKIGPLETILGDTLAEHVHLYALVGNAEKLSISSLLNKSAFYEQAKTVAQNLNSLIAEYAQKNNIKLK